MSLRRLAALALNLPDEAVSRRKTAMPSGENLLALMVEQQGSWGLALLQALLGQQRVNHPSVLRIPRPGDAPQKSRPVETNPAVIAAFFARTG